MANTSFRSFFSINFIDDDTEQAQEHFNDKDYSKIRAIATTEGCLGLLCASLCPDIFGHELVKCGLLLGLLGGSRKADEMEVRPYFIQEQRKACLLVLSETR